MSRKLLAGTVLLSGGILVVVLGLGRREVMYPRSVSSFLEHPMLDQPVRIEGQFVHGSLVHRENPCEFRFRMVDLGASRTDAGLSPSAAELSVRYPQCLVPDTFRDEPGLDVKVTVEGEQCANCHDFEASRLLASVGGGYQMKERYPILERPNKPQLPRPE